MRFSSGCSIAEEETAIKRSARSYTLTLTLLCVPLTLAPLSGAESQPAAVEGKHDPAVDVQAVQKAVDQGGTVLLKGRFDFGDKGSVTITKDVNVLGETDERGAPRTTIRGGYYTFHSPPTGQTPPPPGPKIAIKNIHFDGALVRNNQVVIEGQEAWCIRGERARNREALHLRSGCTL
ncbi:MAG: hypothetical protein A3F74_17230 [Betaproteobacteria bacterium RIFCSPLOWO2_12_FULL_62_58]|nr:MAG: hypothetical protein A3I62_05330 [Betaproteobacteria bacterium RIFCSPLOWO2_02_FULL_62_79]OGA51111.1 MAG: hypothetical protein A3F74_17230 [Betaproteobacteria bacterium RIFCSPLOWO2_12_FULL_62_58]